MDETEVYCWAIDRPGVPCGVSVGRVVSWAGLGSRQWQWQFTVASIFNPRPTFEFC